MEVLYQLSYEGEVARLAAFCRTSTGALGLNRRTGIGKPVGKREETDGPLGGRGRGFGSKQGSGDGYLYVPPGMRLSDTRARASPFRKPIKDASKQTRKSISLTVRGSSSWCRLLAEERQNAPRGAHLGSWLKRGRGRPCGGRQV
jgi:hypothetical protein